MDSLCKRFEPDTRIFLHRVSMERMIKSWPDALAVCQASTRLGDVPLMWFLHQVDPANTNWADFDSLMRNRFGESEETTISRVTNRKQLKDESL